MALLKGGTLGLRNLRRHGLDSIVLAGQVCLQAEGASAVPVRGISLKNGILHLSIAPENLLQFKLHQRQLLSKLDEICTQKSLPPVSRIKLTVEAQPAPIQVAEPVVEAPINWSSD